MVGAVFGLGTLTGILVSPCEPPAPVKLHPIILCSYFSDRNTVAWRLSITNTYAFELDPATGKRLTFDYIYGNHATDAIEKRDGNKL